MRTMNVSLSQVMKSFVDGQVVERGYGTSSEYVRDLIRRDQQRLQLRSLLLQGGLSAPAAGADAAYFGGLREKVRNAGEKGSQGRRQVKAKAVIPRKQANQDVEDAIVYCLSEGAGSAALDFVDELKNAYSHVSRHPGTGSMSYAHPHTPELCRRCSRANAPGRDRQ